MGTETKKPAIDDVLHDAGDLLELRKQLGEAKGRQKSAIDRVTSADREVAEAQVKVDAAEKKFIKTFKEML